MDRLFAGLAGLCAGLLGGAVSKAISNEIERTCPRWQLFAGRAFLACVALAAVAAWIIWS